MKNDPRNTQARVQEFKLKVHFRSYRSCQPQWTDTWYRSKLFDCLAMDQLMDRRKPIKTKNVKKRRRTVWNAINIAVIGLSANQDSFAAVSVSEQLSQTEQLTIDVNSIDRFSRSLDHLLPSFGPVETEPDENFSNFEPEDDCTKFDCASLCTSMDEIHQLLRWELIEGKQRYHLSNSKVTFLQPEQ